MKTKVTYKIAKLLKEKGFDLECYDYYTLRHDSKNPYRTKGEEYNSDRYIKFDWNCNSDSAKSIKAPYPNTYHESQCSAPTVVEVLMWLYEKHGIWIVVYEYKDHAADINDNFVFKSNYTNQKEFTTPTEAYQEAIKYCLSNLKL